MDVRLPAHIEASALIREVQAGGGFATVLQKGERDAGTILVILAENGANQRLYERMPQLDGPRAWSCTRRENPENPRDFADYVQRRAAQDRDLWILELDIANGERFIVPLAKDD